MDEKSLSFLEQKLKTQYGEEEWQALLSGFSSPKKTALRANALKATGDEVAAYLSAAKIPFERLAFFPDAFSLPPDSEQAVAALPFYEEGKIYLQNPSSMIPPLCFGSDLGKTVLDMAAAPGGKTCLLSALAGGAISITACEANPRRAERLRYNLKKQGVPRVNVITGDARKLDENFRFDAVMLDAPCSGSGTLSPSSSPRAAFSQENLQKTVRLQSALLQKAVKLLKKGGTLIYSTCSLFREENEQIVRCALQGGACSLVPLDFSLFSGVPRLSSTLDGVMTVRPTDVYEGFFVAKLKKN